MTYQCFNQRLFATFKQPLFLGEQVNVSRYDRQKYPIFEQLIEKQLNTRLTEEQSMRAMQEVAPRVAEVYMQAAAVHSAMASVLQSGSINTEPAFSPDGSALFFVSDRGGAPR